MQKPIWKSFSDGFCSRFVYPIQMTTYETMDFFVYRSRLDFSSPFDINANETGTGLKLNIDEEDNSLDT